MPHIFISYRREDSSGHAGRLYDRLQVAFGREGVFMDVDSLVPGDDFVRAIQEGVGACEVAIALIGPDWVSATDARGRRRLENPLDFVRLELEAALARGIRVIPALVQNAAMPLAEELPLSLVELSHRHAIEISDTRFNYDVDRLIGAIRRSLDASPRQDAPAMSAEQTAPTAGAVPESAPAEPPPPRIDGISATTTPEEAPPRTKPDERRSGARGKQCPVCGRLNHPRDRTCWNCKARLPRDD